MTKKEENIDNLIDGIRLTIQCSKCNAVEIDNYHMDLLEAAASFYKDGWRATEENIYCPVCAKTFKLK
jgi:hypothetical protein